MTETRQYWLDTMVRITSPVLENLSCGKLKEKMPVEHKDGVTDRADYTYLEALGRTVCGIAPWLAHTAEDPSEEKLRIEYAEMTRKAISAAVTSSSPDCMNFENGYQPIVDAAFLANGLLRAPDELYFKLDNETKSNLIRKLKSTRTRKPPANNWLLFSATIEAFLCYIGEPDWDPMRIDYALRQHMQWYRGDGIYSDGNDFHFDYYNSFVIQPMLVDILNTKGATNGDWDYMREKVMLRASRYASVLEQLIAPDGSYPVIGRSSCYRFGAFQSLAQAALLDNCGNLPKSQIRCALTAVIKRVMQYEEMFDENGFLTIGVCGHQPNMGESYISTGSLYLCSAVFLPLGLPESDLFWQDPDCYWTSKKIWNSENTQCDHALT